MKLSNSCKTVLILGIGNGSFIYFPEITYEANSFIFLWYYEGGGTHSDAGWNSNTPRSQRLLNSSIIVSVCTLDTGNSLPCYGLVPAFSSKETGWVCQSHSVPSKSSSYSVSNSSNLFWSWRLRWVQLVLTTDWRSACSYLASKIWHSLWVASCIQLGLHAMLLFTAQAFFMFDLVRLLMSLIGKMISSMVISFVQKSRTIPSSLMVLQPRMMS